MDSDDSSESEAINAILNQYKGLPEQKLKTRRNYSIPRTAAAKNNTVPKVQRGSRRNIQKLQDQTTTEEQRRGFGHESAESPFTSPRYGRSSSKLDAEGAADRRLHQQTPYDSLLKLRHTVLRLKESLALRRQNLLQDQSHTLAFIEESRKARHAALRLESSSESAASSDGKGNAGMQAIGSQDIEYASSKGLAGSVRSEASVNDTLPRGEDERPSKRRRQQGRSDQTTKSPSTSSSLEIATSRQKSLSRGSQRGKGTDSASTLAQPTQPPSAPPITAESSSTDERRGLKHPRSNLSTSQAAGSSSEGSGVQLSWGTRACLLQALSSETLARRRPQWAKQRIVQALIRTEGFPPAYWICPTSSQLARVPPSCNNCKARKQRVVVMNPDGLTTTCATFEQIFDLVKPRAGLPERLIIQLQERFGQSSSVLAIESRPPAVSVLTIPRRVPSLVSKEVLEQALDKVTFYRYNDETKKVVRVQTDGKDASPPRGAGGAAAGGSGRSGRAAGGGAPRPPGGLRRPLQLDTPIACIDKSKSRWLLSSIRRVLNHSSPEECKKVLAFFGVSKPRDIRYRQPGSAPGAAQSTRVVGANRLLDTAEDACSDSNDPIESSSAAEVPRSGNSAVAHSAMERRRSRLPPAAGLIYRESDSEIDLLDDEDEDEGRRESGDWVSEKGAARVARREVLPAAAKGDSRQRRSDLAGSRDEPRSSASRHAAIGSGLDMLPSSSSAAAATQQRASGVRSRATCPLQIYESMHINEMKDHTKRLAALIVQGKQSYWVGDGIGGLVPVAKWSVGHADTSLPLGCRTTGGSGWVISTLRHIREGVRSGLVDKGCCEKVFSILHRSRAPQVMHEISHTEQGSSGPPPSHIFSSIARPSPPQVAGDFVLQLLGGETAYYLDDQSRDVVKLEREGLQPHLRTKPMACRSKDGKRWLVCTFSRCSSGISAGNITRRELQDVMSMYVQRKAVSCRVPILPADSSSSSGGSMKQNQPPRDALVSLPTHVPYSDTDEMIVQLSTGQPTYCIDPASDQVVEVPKRLVAADILHLPVACKSSNGKEWVISSFQRIRARLGNCQRRKDRSPFWPGVVGLVLAVYFKKRSWKGTSKGPDWFAPAIVLSPQNTAGGTGDDRVEHRDAARPGEADASREEFGWLPEALQRELEDDLLGAYDLSKSEVSAETRVGQGVGAASTDWSPARRSSPAVAGVMPRGLDVVAQAGDNPGAFEFKLSGDQPAPDSGDRKKGDLGKKIRSSRGSPSPKLEQSSLPIFASGADSSHGMGHRGAEGGMVGFVAFGTDACANDIEKSQSESGRQIPSALATKGPVLGGSSAEGRSVDGTGKKALTQPGGPEGSSVRSSGLADEMADADGREGTKEKACSPMIGMQELTSADSSGHSASKSDSPTTGDALGSRLHSAASGGSPQPIQKQAKLGDSASKQRSGSGSGGSGRVELVG